MLILYKLIKNFITFIADNFNEFLEKNGPYMAAAISFYAFLSLFPLLIALIAIFSFILGDLEIEERIIIVIQQYVPVLRAVDDEFISDFFRSLRAGQVFSSTFATLGLLLSSTAVFSAIRKSVNAIWGIRKTRPFLIERLMDFSLMLGTAFILGISILLSVLLGFIRYISDLLIPGTAPPQVWQVLAQLIPPSLSFIAFTILYWWLPNISISFKHVWLTSLAATTSFEISKQIFIWYLRNLGDIASNIYGGVSSVIVLLAFVYVTAIIMLVGAMLTAEYTVYLERKSQFKINQKLSQDLERIRKTPYLIHGMEEQLRYQKL